MQRREFIQTVATGAATFTLYPTLKGASPLSLSSLPSPGSSTNAYRIRFESPPATLRPMPQWSWNGNIERDRVVEVLRQYAEQGCGGVFMHARWGISQNYLSEDWFELWEFAREEAEKLGLEWNIYDEFTAPGGHAGGHTVAVSPHVVQQEMKLVPVLDPKTRIRSDVFGWFKPGGKDGRLILVDASEQQNASMNSPIFALVRERVNPKHVGNEFPLPDLTHPDAVKTFIETTYVPYTEHSGKSFGKNVRFSFCDEPHLNAPRDSWPISLYILSEFEREHGYDLRDHIEDLCLATKESPRVRYQYWSTMNRLWNHNFMKPLHDYCEANGLEFTGHLMEHEWPKTTSQPDAMASFRWMQAPGNDLLGLQFKFDSHEINAIYFLNLKELSSVANQLGRKHVVVESSGAAGYWADYDLFKPCEDYLAALGTTVYSPHIMHYTLSGVRKYDFAQSISDHSPWWKFYHHHANHVGRLVSALYESKEENRVLVMHPTTTAWLYSVPEGDMWSDEASRNAFSRIKPVQEKLLLDLYADKIDFDLGDEFIIEEFGRVEGKNLVVGEARYEVLVLPETIETILPSTLELLRKWMAAGGRVIDAGANISRLGGVASKAPSELKQASGKNWQTAGTTDKLLKAVKTAVPPRIEAKNASDLVWRRAVFTGQGTLWFFCNPWLETIKTTARIPGGQAIEMDTQSGNWIPREAVKAGGELAIEMNLPPRAHALYLVKDSELYKPVPPLPVADKVLDLKLNQIRNLDTNLLIIDYCDLDAGSAKATNVQAPEANRVLWTHAGWEDLARGRLKNFGDLQTTKYLDPELHARVSYHFEVDSSTPGEVLQGLKVAVERPQHFIVRLNGRNLSREWTQWFDVEMATHPIGDLVRKGSNTLEILSNPLSRQLEIAPVYVLGDFCLRPTNKGFVITGNQPLQLGNWTKQGAPFYANAFRYSFETKLDAPVDRMELELPDWAGSVANIHLDSNEIGAIMHPPYRIQLPATDSGRHRIDIDVYGKMQNMMGPFIDVPGFHISHWTRSPKHQPAGNEYRTLPSGLNKMPELRV